MTRTLIILFLLVQTCFLNAQEAEIPQTYSVDDFFERVRQFHPIMQNLPIVLRQQAEAALLEARGGFDPKLYGDYEDKQFDNKNYFRKGEGGLKVPLWFGADIKAAYTWADGVFLDNENYLPTAGQAVLGIEMPILQGMFFDERRAQVEQAKLLQQTNEIEQVRAINDLILAAAESYWNWSYHYRVLKIYENSLSLSEARFDLIKQSFLQGDKPAIDTLEAMIQVQNREVQRNQALADFENAGLELSNFIWGSNLVPLQVSATLVPEEPKPEKLNPFWLQMDLSPASFNANHPDLQKLAIKQQSLKIKERLKRESFKPQLNLNFNLLGDGTNFLPGVAEGSGITQLLTENYKWGGSFSYPLFLRKARGGMQLVQLEQIENNIQINLKRLELQNKTGVLVRQSKNIVDQIRIQEKAVSNYQSLLDAENEKFRIGESSVFLLNSREQKLIDATLKLAKSQVEYRKAEYKAEWSLGRLR